MSKRGTAGTALAASNGSAPAVEKVITNTQAIAIVRKAAADSWRDAKRQQADQVRQLEAIVGGETKRIDESVIQQAKALMTRIALIARRRDDHHTNTAALDSIVKKLGGVIGELEAFQLTNKAVGLFETLNEHDYRGYTFGGHSTEKNPLAHAGRKARDAAEAALSGYVIVDDPKKGKGEKNVTLDASKGRTVADLSATISDDEDIADELADDDDEDDGACRVCGCTEDNACEGGCTWVESDLCSSCVGKEAVA
jgi:hypothetical protein